MLIEAVNAYLKLRRSCGFKMRSAEFHLRSFAQFSTAKGQDFVSRQTAIEWAGLSRSTFECALRLRDVIGFARYIRAEDSRHEVPPAVFGSRSRPRSIPYILSQETIQRLIQAASQAGDSPLRQHTYGTLFGLLACTGLRVSEALRLRDADITPDGLLIRNTKFRKSRLVPLHDTARVELQRYLACRRPYAPLDDHVFISLRRKPILYEDARLAFQTAAKTIGLPCAPVRPRPTLHSLRHSFAVRSLETCLDDRDHVGQQMLALSTYLGHSKIAHTYWYLEATPELMTQIAQRCEQRFQGARP